MNFSENYPIFRVKEERFIHLFPLYVLPFLTESIEEGYKSKTKCKQKRKRFTFISAAQKLYI